MRMIHLHLKDQILYLAQVVKLTGIKGKTSLRNKLKRSKNTKEEGKLEL